VPGIVGAGTALAITGTDEATTVVVGTEKASNHAAENIFIIRHPPLASIVDIGIHAVDAALTQDRSDAWTEPA
jgi:hypothetical protein